MGGGWWGEVGGGMVFWGGGGLGEGRGRGRGRWGGEGASVE